MLLKDASHAIASACVCWLVPGPMACQFFAHNPKLPHRRNWRAPAGNASFTDAGYGPMGSIRDVVSPEDLFWPLGLRRLTFAGTCPAQTSLLLWKRAGWATGAGRAAIQCTHPAFPWPARDGLQLSRLLGNPAGWWTN